MVFRCSDNTRDILEPGSGSKAVAKWDNTCPRQTPRGLWRHKGGKRGPTPGEATRGGKKRQERSPEQA